LKAAHVYDFAAVNPRKLLFICSRNKWRSRTAEELFRGYRGYDMKSAGNEPGARIRVTEELLGWADLIFVMERKHADYLRAKFPEAIESKPVHCLRIPDDFEFMDEDLITMLKSSLSEYLTVPDWKSAVSAQPDSA
jgi:predicted protein tyrosine phosphatase